MTRLLPLLASLLIATSAMAEPGIINAPRGTTVQMRSGPADAFDTLRLLRPGATVEVLEEDPAGMWSRVRDASGTTGWVPQTALSQPTEDIQPLQRDADRPDYIRRDVSGSDGYATAPDHSREQVYVNSPSAGRLNLRQGPGTDTAILGTLDHGAAVTILGGGDPWRRVRSADGQVGYVHNAYLSSDTPTIAPAPVQPEPGRVLQSMYVNAPRYGALNLRQGPGTQYDIAETMPQGARVEVLDGGTDTWRFVRSANGQLGFAHVNYLSPTRPSAARMQRQEYREYDENGRRVIRVSPQELTGLLAVCAFSGNLDRCMVRQLERRERR